MGMKTCRKFGRGGNSRKGETGKHFVHDIAVGELLVNVDPSLFFEDRYIVLKSISKWIPITIKAVTLSASR